MSEDQKNTSAQDTLKNLPVVKSNAEEQKRIEATQETPKITEEMLERFSDKKPDHAKTQIVDSESQDSTNEEADTEDANDVLVAGENAEGKTIIDFKEDSINEKEQKPKIPPKQHKPFFLLKLFIGVFVVALVLASFFGIWNRWFRYDDAQEIISNWQIHGTNNVVVIDKKTINLGPNAVLEYTIDTGAKVIHYKTGDKIGVSHYRFSWDHNQVAIIESSGSDPFSTMISDLIWFWDQSTCQMNGIDLSPAYTKNNTQEVDTENTGLDDIMNNGQSESILLDRVATQKPKEAQ